MDPHTDSATGIPRRSFLGFFAATGLGSTLLPGTLWSAMAETSKAKVSEEMVAHAAYLAGLEFSDAELTTIARGVNRLRGQYIALRELPLSNDIPPALEFNPVPTGTNLDHLQTENELFPLSPVTGTPPPDNERDLAFLPIAALSGALHDRTVTSEQITKILFERMERLNPTLECVVTLTRERALAQAGRADRELDAGDSRGLLHGIPWGAKDLLAVAGYPTTWGAMPYRAQHFDHDAAVVRKLDEAGAVLLAKLSLGALAQGDVWYDGRTNSPWNPRRGSSGSSAGPGAATAAGLVSFSIGSETSGSIISPSTVCGLTGLRPTFGRVSRQGAMALSWSMDKLGPMCRSVEDCAIVFNIIHGRDDADPATVDLPFNWKPDIDPGSVRVGYVQDAFAKSTRPTDAEALEKMEQLGFRMRPIALPDFPDGNLGFILSVEAAAAFDELTRSNRDDELVSQAGTAWPNTFRTARMVPAVEYIQANRARTLLIRRMHEVMKDIDVYLAPTMHRMILTNLTGHPMISLPTGFSKAGEPQSIGITGKLYEESRLLAVAGVYQNATQHHLQRPRIS